MQTINENDKPLVPLNHWYRLCETHQTIPSWLLNVYDHNHKLSASITDYLSHSSHDYSILTFCHLSPPPSMTIESMDLSILFMRTIMRVFLLQRDRTNPQSGQHQQPKLRRACGNSASRGPTTTQIQQPYRPATSAYGQPQPRRRDSSPAAHANKYLTRLPQVSGGSVTRLEDHLK